MTVYYYLIETILGIVVGVSGLEGQYKFYTICIMAGLFLVVFVGVIIVTFMRPTHLYENISKDVMDLTEVIDSKGIEDLIEDTIKKRIKSECLTEQERR